MRDVTWSTWAGPTAAPRDHTTTIPPPLRSSFSTLIIIRDRNNHSAIILNDYHEVPTSSTKAGTLAITTIIFLSYTSSNNEPTKTDNDYLSVNTCDVGRLFVVGACGGGSDHAWLRKK